MAKAGKTKVTKTGVTQQFAFSAPAALSVLLVGDFTQWHEKPIPLQNGEDGVWRASIQLAPGKYHYRFLVDGQWRDDPECTLRVPNPYGSEDMVRHVGPADAHPISRGQSGIAAG